MIANRTSIITFLKDMKKFDHLRSNLFLAFFLLLINIFTSCAFGEGLNIHLTNAISGQAIANSEIVVYKKLPDGSLKWSGKKTTDAVGSVTFDLPGLGQDTQYKFRTKPYSTGIVFSDFVNSPGSFDFKVGKLEATVIQGATSQPLSNYWVEVKKVLPNGKFKWTAGGKTNTQGIIRFDIPELGKGNKYVLSAVSPFDGTIKTSNVFSQNGKITFTVGNQLLNVHLTNAISGQTLPNEYIIVTQRQPDGSLKWIQRKKTNTEGKVSFDLAEIGKGKTYFLQVHTYGSKVISEPISQPGSFNFKIGKIQIRLKNETNQQLLAGKRLTLVEKTSDGKIHPKIISSTNAHGIAHFDPSELSQSKIYLAKAYNLFGNKKIFYSQLIAKSGVIDFLVSPDGNHSTDLTPPDITILSPIYNSQVSDKGFILEAKITDENNIKDVNFEVIDSIKNSSSGKMTLEKGKWKFTATPEMLSPSNTVKIVISATDEMENTTMVAHQLQVINDQSPPLLRITSHQNLNQVSENGFFLNGTVSDNTSIKSLTATVNDPLNGVIINNKPIQFNKNGGNWSLSVRNFKRNSTISVSLLATDFADNSTTEELQLNVMTSNLNGRQLIDRLTFGATPELASQIKTEYGIENFLFEQLNPELIDNSEFEIMIDQIGEPQNAPSLQNYQLAHAIYSKRQLQEMMTWFWENHFNTAISKTGFVAEFRENKKFRTHALGNFRDLLQISATSKAMLIYLDNRLNRKEEPNENYARELLELHTLGVNGGYTAKDIVEVAKAFTGWSFQFSNKFHDQGEKIVLGSVIPAGFGEEDGNRVLDLLATHPSTAQFICTKLLRYFVSDSPSTSSISDCADTFLENRQESNQIAIVLESIFRSSDFSASLHFHSKVKTPLEFVAAFLRQFPIQISFSDTRYSLRAMNMNLFYYPNPTGWPEVGEQWINSYNYLQYFQFINNVIFNKPSPSKNYFESPVSFFKNNNLETAEGIVGYIFHNALSHDYSSLEWNTAMGILTENGNIDFDINDPDAEKKIRTLLATILSFPKYQLQ
jgi:hypothetical protein